MIYADAPGTTQDTLTVRLAAMAETFVGGFLIGNFTKGVATSRVSIAIALIVLREGQTVSALNLSEGSPLYSPEQDVLWATVFDTAKAADSDLVRDFTVQIKAQRKLKIGDTLRLINVSSAANGGNIFASFTGFYKQ